MITSAQFRDCYSVISAPVLLVEPTGLVVAFNSSAQRALNLSTNAESIYMQDLFSDDEEKIARYLEQCARTKSAMPGALSSSGSAKSARYSVRGQLLNVPQGERAGQVVLYLQPKEKVVEEFLVLNDKIKALAKEIIKRQKLEEERGRLLAKEKQAKEEALHLFEQAQAATQAKSLFLAQMSHEIRTPLNAILGYSELLSESQTIGKNDRDFLRRVHTNGKQLLRIIDDILDLSKFEAGKVAVENIKFSIVELINEVVYTLRPLAQGKNLQIILTLRTSVPQVIQSDTLRLRQVLLNLIGNAIKFTESGHIEVRLSFSPTSSGRKSPCFKIEVEDTGIGISAEQQTRLFKAFEQGDSSTNRRFGGTGLGLTISQKIARALGGNLELARSSQGSGTTFLLSIPTGDITDTLFVSQVEESYKSQERALRSVKTGQKKLVGRCILLAEDAPDSAALVTLYLQTQGAEVIHVINGFDAVKAVETNEFDLVLMDIQMPGMDGLKATTLLREKKFARPILALTAHALREEAERSFRAGCNAHLTKPIQKDELINEILKVLADFNQNQGQTS